MFRVTIFFAQIKFDILLIDWCAKIYEDKGWNKENSEAWTRVLGATDMITKIPEQYAKQASSIYVQNGYHLNLYTGENQNDFGKKFTRWHESLGEWDDKLSYYQCRCGTGECCNWWQCF